ncbi:hypothetical protein [Nostoc sp. LPT]|nr:hypothetical protein [Nostoc sp. LPT]MBN4001766.1 hypothetical protein [Nostoc sp. LPT]
MPVILHAGNQNLDLVIAPFQQFIFFIDSNPKWASFKFLPMVMVGDWRN